MVSAYKIQIRRLRKGLNELQRYVNRIDVKRRPGMIPVSAEYYIRYAALLNTVENFLDYLYAYIQPRQFVSGQAAMQIGKNQSFSF